MKITEKHIGTALFAAASLWLAVRAYPSSKEKAQRPLYLNPPVESPDGIRFTWANGAQGDTFRIMQRIKGTDEWQPVAIGLPPSGAHTLEGFTLDKDYEYRIEAEVP